MKRCAIYAVIVLCGIAVATFTADVQAAPQKKQQAPASDIESSKEQPTALTGKIVETMNSGGYTYINLEQKNGKKIWVAVPEMKVKTGQAISLRPGYVMPNFKSKSLERTFEEIIFSGGPAASSADTGGLPAGHSDIGEKTGGSKAAATPATKDVKVEKAGGADAYTIGEIFAKRAALNNKTVVVKGKVVKVSEGIMGKNWIHLQDGTGDQKKNTHNLVATTDDHAAVGDVVTVTGTLVKDKDFGAGYKYDVIMEKAKIQK